MLILAHRGRHDSAPENTLAAFRAAVTAGADGIETDLRLDANGELVLFHDRFAPDGRSVESLTRDELSRAAGYAVPSLAEALDEEADILWNLEIKVYAALQPTVALLGQFAGRRRILVTSFLHPVVTEIVSRLDVEGGLLVAHDPAPDQPFLRRHPRLRSIVFNHETATAETLRRATEAGLHVYLYNPTTAEDHRRALACGVHGLITDHLDLVLRDAQMRRAGPAQE
jgi:glycerophosphoryl diester phosphodiesterase